MEDRPRPVKEGLLDWGLIARSYGWLGLMEAGAAMAAFFFVLNRGHWQFGQMLGAKDPLYLQATTACLSAIIVIQVVNVFLCRSRRQSAFSFGLLSNRLILWGILTEIALILLIDYHPWTNLVFGTAPIPKEAWLFVIPLP